MATLTLTWVDTSGDGGGLASDILYGAIVNDTLKENISIPPLKTRADGLQTIVLPDGWAVGNSIYIYGAWRRADGLDCSDTMYAET